MKKRRPKKIIFVFVFITSLGLFFSLMFLGLFLYYAKDLPRPESFTEKKIFESTKIYDRTGEVLLYEIYGEEKRTWMPLEKIPKHLQEAVIATEDANFYHHFGIDLKAILRAILIDLKLKKPLYGASTIPQQLVRSTYLSLEKTIQRKIKEIILAIELDRRYSKEQILEWYLNQVPFGQNAYGVEAASQTYFGKSVSRISIAEAATLAALIHAPYKLSPFESESKERLLERKNYVLDRMVQEGYLTKEEAEKTKKEEIVFKKEKVELKAPYFTLWVLKQLKEKYSEEFLMRKGLKVYTTLDWEFQQIAEKVVREGIKKNKSHNAHNAALMAINPKTGQVLAMTVGTGNYYEEPYPLGCQPGEDCLFDPQFNVVTALPGRQPGSAFKPFVYVTAFEKGYDDKYVVVDEETNFGTWGGKPYIPQNYDGKFRGPVTLREALAQSLNVPSVKVLAFLAGLKESIETAKKLGITTLNKPASFYGLSIVLGGGEVRLIDMVSAYGVFATEGLKTQYTGILKIEDTKGNIVEKINYNPKRVLSKKSTRLINDILSDNKSRAPMFGLNSVMYFKDYQIAAKTGTTQDYRDGWIIGYTPSIVVGVWVGNNNNEPMVNAPGVVVAGPIWKEFLNKVLFKLPKENFNKP